MTDKITPLHGADLPAIAREAHQHELTRQLSGLETKDGKNYAIYDYPKATPAKGLTILPFPSVGPTGSTKLFEGNLTIGTGAIKVDAYRLG